MTSILECFAERRVQLEAQEEWEWREEEEELQAELQGELHAELHAEELQAEGQLEQEEARQWMEETSQQRDAKLREALEQIRHLEEAQAAEAAGSSLPATLPYPTGSTPQPVVNPTPTGARGCWDFTRQRYQPTTPVAAPLQSPGTSTASTGVPSLAPSIRMASSQAMAFPAMAPMTPLGAFQPQQPAGLINLLGQPLPQADEFKTQKSPLPKLQMKGGDATVVTRIINEWVQKTALALNTWSSSAVLYWH